MPEASCKGGATTDAAWDQYGQDDDRERWRTHTQLSSARHLSTTLFGLRWRSLSPPVPQRQRHGDTEPGSLEAKNLIVFSLGNACGGGRGETVGAQFFIVEPAGSAPPAQDKIVKLAEPQG
jgi:hypothetical protein